MGRLVLLVKNAYKIVKKHTCNKEKLIILWASLQTLLKGLTL